MDRPDSNINWTVHICEEHLTHLYEAIKSLTIHFQQFNEPSESNFLTSVAITIPKTLRYKVLLRMMQHGIPFTVYQKYARIMYGRIDEEGRFEVSRKPGPLQWLSDSWNNQIEHRKRWELKRLITPE